MSKKKIKTISKLQDGKCPLCGSELEYVGPREIDDNGSTVPWLCINCGATGNEGYTEVFDAHYKVHDRDGNEVTLESLPLEPVRDDDLLCEAGDTLDNAADSLIVALSAAPVGWDMSLIAQVKDAVAGILKGRNIPVCIPWENEDEHICYSLPGERCAHCTHSYLYLDGLTVAINGDDDIVMSIYDDVLRVDWYNAGEGICGDFNPDDPKDVNLLRFDVYIKGNESGNKEWLEVTDASYCTNMPATASEDVLEKALRYIFNRYRNVITGPDCPPVKKLGEELSHISEDDFLVNNISASDQEERNRIEYWFNRYEKAGFTETFQTPFGQYKDRVGQKFSVIGRCTEKDCDSECLPMWKIQFEDGFVTDAHPNEICKLEARRSEELLRCAANSPTDEQPETKTLYVTENCNAVYCSSIQVPIHMNLEEAIAYAKAHQEAIPLGVLDYVHGSSKLDEENCSFD